MSNVERVAEAIARTSFDGDKSMTFDMLTEAKKVDLIRLYTPEATAAIAAIVPEDHVVVPKDVRKWSHFPITVPLKDGRGPADVSDCDKLSYEVWDQFLMCHASHDYQPDAINAAISMTSKELK